MPMFCRRLRRRDVRGETDSRHSRATESSGIRGVRTHGSQARASTAPCKCGPWEISQLRVRRRQGDKNAREETSKNEKATKTIYVISNLNN